MNNGFGLNLLPHHGVVADFGDVVEDVDIVVLVALSQDPALALLQDPLDAKARRHGAAPRSATCTLVPVPIFSVRPDQHGYLATIALGEQGFQFGRLARLVDEPNRLGRTFLAAMSSSLMAW